MLTYPKVLLLSSDETETSVMEKILSEHVILRSIGDLAELRNHLDGAYDALFCGWSFQKGGWNEALKQVRKRCPDLPVVIFSRVGGEQEWVEALEAGAFDLLVAPYLKRNVLPLLEHAVASHEARRWHNAAFRNSAMAV